MQYVNQTTTTLLLILATVAGSFTASNVRAAGIDVATNTVTLALSEAPRTLNSLTAESVSYTAQLMVHIQEGLMRYDRRRRLVGGVAERWSVDAETMRFWLREDAHWQNGEPVTAADFVFAWQQLVTPATGAPSANLASPIKNAAKILRGEAPASSLGVTATGPLELLVELEHPCAWCLKLMTNSIFYPVSQAFFEQSGTGYGASKEKQLSNGAFQLAQWQRGKVVRLQKNPHYWGRQRILLDHLNFDYIGSDARTSLNLFRSGEIAAAYLDRDTIKEALDQGLRVKTFPSGHLYHIQFSHLSGKLSANLDLRKAIALTINRDELVNKVVASPGTRRADSMFHDWLTVGNKKYLTERPAAQQNPDIEAAQAHVARARASLGIKDELIMTLTVSDNELSRRVAEYLQQQLNTHLGITVKIDPQITQMLVDKWRQGAPDMTLTTWPVDMDDPMDQISFMGNPDFRRIFKGLYGGQDMAELYFKNRNTLDESARLDAITEANTLMTDKVTVLPLFESYGAVTIDPLMKGFVWQPVRGYADYRAVRLR